MSYLQLALGKKICRGKVFTLPQFRGGDIGGDQTVPFLTPKEGE